VLRIFSPYTCLNTRDNKALSAGTQTNRRNHDWVSRVCIGPVTAPLKRRLHVMWLVDCGDYEELRFSLSPDCLLINLDKGPRLNAHCLSTCLCIPNCVGPVQRFFTLTEITDVSEYAFFTIPAFLLHLKLHRFCGNRLDKGIREALAYMLAYMNKGNNSMCLMMNKTIRNTFWLSVNNAHLITNHQCNS